MSRRTIVNDLKFLRSHLREVALDLDAVTEVAAAAEELLVIKAEALRSARQAQSLRDRAALFRVAGDSAVRRIELLRSCGLLQTTPNASEFSFAPLDFQSLSTEALREHRRKLFERAKELIEQQLGYSQSIPQALPLPAPPPA